MKQDWIEFINTRIENEHVRYNNTEEAHFRRTVETQQEEILETNLTKEEKLMVDEVMFARCLSLESEGARLYQQGMMDCVGVLRMLGVLR